MFIPDVEFETRAGGKYVISKREGTWERIHPNPTKGPLYNRPMVFQGKEVKILTSRREGSTRGIARLLIVGPVVKSRILVNP